jgi:hypothetical protein
MNFKIFVLAASFIVMPFSQATETANGWWIGTYAKKSLSQSFTGTMETQIRSSFENGQVGQILYRAGILYKLNPEKSQNVGFLYGIIQSGSSVEKRYTFQHGINYFNDNINKLGHRVRVEGRDLRGSANDSIRVRYSLKYTREFSSFTGIISDEVFINATDEDDRNQDRFERNRFFVGVGFNAFNTKFVTGYLNQYVPRKTVDTMEHIMTLYWHF